MKLMKVAFVAFAAVSFSASALAQSRAVQLTDAQMGKLTAGGSMTVDNRGADPSNTNNGQDGTSFTRYNRNTTVCKNTYCNGG